MLVMRKMQEILARQGSRLALSWSATTRRGDSPANWRRTRGTQAARELALLERAEGRPTRRLADFLEMKYWVYARARDA